MLDIKDIEDAITYVEALLPAPGEPVAVVVPAGNTAKVATPVIDAIATGKTLTINGMIAEAIPATDWPALLAKAAAIVDRAIALKIRVRESCEASAEEKVYFQKQEILRQPDCKKSKLGGVITFASVLLNKRYVEDGGRGVIEDGK